MKIVEEATDQALIFALQGRLDSNTAPELQERLLSQLEAAPAVIIDSAGLDYISSAGLRVLLMAAKRCKQLDRQLAICNLQEAVHEVFEISGFLTIMSHCRDRAEALERVTA
jgi:anti-anti-sigma factor